MQGIWRPSFMMAIIASFSRQRARSTARMNPSSATSASYSSMELCVTPLRTSAARNPARTVHATSGGRPSAEGDPACLTLKRWMKEGRKVRAGACNGSMTVVTSGGVHQRPSTWFTNATDRDSEFRTPTAAMVSRTTSRYGSQLTSTSSVRLRTTARALATAGWSSQLSLTRFTLERCCPGRYRGQAGNEFAARRHRDCACPSSRAAAAWRNRAGSGAKSLTGTGSPDDRMCHARLWPGRSGTSRRIPPRLELSPTDLASWPEHRGSLLGFARLSRIRQDWTSPLWRSLPVLKPTQ